MAILFKNNVSTTLASSINNSVTSISVTAGQGAQFPSITGSDYFYATLVDSSNNLEIVKVTARSTDTLTVVRGQEGTTARAYSAGDKLEMRVTAQTLTDLGDGVNLSTAEVNAIIGYTPLNKAGDTITGYMNNSSTGAMRLPASTTANRPASPNAGDARLNTTTNKFEGYNGTDWGALGAGATGGGTDGVFYENDQTVTTDYTLGTNKNAMSAGPIQINAGVTVTIPSGATWTIV